MREIKISATIIEMVSATNKIIIINILGSKFRFKIKGGKRYGGIAV